MDTYAFEGLWGLLFFGVLLVAILIGWTSTARSGRVRLKLRPGVPRRVALKFIVLAVAVVAFLVFGVVESARQVFAPRHHERFTVMGKFISDGEYDSRGSHIIDTSYVVDGAPAAYKVGAGLYRQLQVHQRYTCKVAHLPLSGTIVEDCRATASSHSS